jgi:four helix bundle protein
MGSKSYRDLLVWQKGIDLVKEIYLLSDQFPNQEIYGLTNQIRRAAVSIPSNIAEGQGRNNNKEFRRYLKIALGSIAEIDTQLEISRSLGFITNEQTNQFQNKITDLRRMIYGLIKNLPST